MIVVHHLNESRSQRILWLLEELQLPYEIKFYARDAVTRLAPPELKAIHPLGKSPVVTVGSDTVIESGAIIDYIIRRHADGRLAPDPASPDHDVYQQWLHYAEGSAMLPLMLNMYVARLGEAGAALHPRIESEIAKIEDTMRKNRSAYNKDEKMQERYRQLLTYQAKQKG